MTKVTKPRVCVGNESDPAEVRKALRGLKMMVRLGHRAQKALDALERDGEYREGIAWLERSGQWRGSGLEDLVVETASGIFPYQGVSREDLPGWKELQLEFGSLDEDERSGQTFKFFPIHLVGKGLAYDSERDEPGHVLETVLAPRRFSEIGQARLKRNGSVTFSSDRSDDDKILKVYRDVTSSDKAWDSAERFAEAVADRLIRANACGFEQDRVPQWLLDLRKEVPGWLIEDGMVQDWFEQILLWAKNVRIVSEVMES